MKIAINGFGRIGRIFFRLAVSAKGGSVSGGNEPDFEIVAINDLGSKDNLLYLLRHDSVYGKFEPPAGAMEKIKFFQEKDPTKLPWKDLGIDVVVEATGFFASSEKAKAHLDAGAKRVVITAPVPTSDEGAITFTPNVGVEFFSEEGKITSNASCTTNAATPVAAIMLKNPGIKKAILNTVHAYTATQGLVDGPADKDFTRGRAASVNIVPSHTGAALAVAKAVPELKGKFDGVAIRVPVVCGSIIDFTFVSARPTSVEEINNILREAAKQPEWQGILRVSEEPLVSADIIADPYGSIVDLTFTRVIDGDLVKILAWYDNEWGYCAMLIKHIRLVCQI
jgi:glyceraldehyde 3-phosphate dehydrogenase